MNRSHQRIWLAFLSALGLCALGLCVMPLPYFPLMGASLQDDRSVQIVGLRGDVRIRRDVEETWSPAGLGMLLKPLDTIFAGEASEAVLALEDGTRFTLGNNAALDAGDLRRISERQLFLFLMSRKVGQMAAPDSTRSIRIANVSVVRGAQRGKDVSPVSSGERQGWMREKNGAKALLDAGWNANAVVKFCTVLDRYPSFEDSGEIHWYLGLAFEALNETGRATDAYQTALERLNRNSDAPGLMRGRLLERKAGIEAALSRLLSNP